LERAVREGRLVRSTGVFLPLVLSLATGCFSFSQFDSEEATRNHREWLDEREHIDDPVSFHASDQPEGLDPPGPTPLFGPRRDPDTISRETRRGPIPLDMSRDAWEDYRREHEVEER
jgi:hypothetical protein